MAVIKLRYTVLRRGKLFWQPTKAMQAEGFLPKPLGEESAESVAEAKRLYEAWLKYKATTKRPTIYPAGTLGAFFDRFTGKFSGQPVLAWRSMAPRSRDDFHRAWVHIDRWRPNEDAEPLSRLVITQITTERCEAFYQHLDTNESPSERYRTIKCLKALLGDAMVRLRLETTSPAAKLKNSQPKGRSQIWLGHEIEQLIQTALANGYPGVALAIMIAWDTLFSPVDIWSATRRQFKRDRTGPYIHRERTKTQKEAFGALSPRTAEALALYIAALPVTLTPDAQLIRMRSGHAYRSKDTFGDDFRAVRRLAFPARGADGEFIEKRQLLDIRRSGNVEADVAGTDKETMGQILANGLADNAFLEDTYTPPTVAKAREVATKREVGRAALKAEAERLARSN